MRRTSIGLQDAPRPLFASGLLGAGNTRRTGIVMPIAEHRRGNSYRRYPGRHYWPTGSDDRATREDAL
jgi:hypothetical protein